ncbi:hypothetical protein FPOA_09382 [Fusarium poae]|uniref:Uncharacterized protein n=1 Tax=Fusarium poae TaxID=36050 RepID=A0A1B8AAZ4_FUSPO|nr:hypothetical protein FPOA_09382 [Fusarium poae]
MDPKLNLTTLPSEIRQQIFREYFKVDKGYVYDVAHDKLTVADDAHTPIDLSLRYTCRSIAADTKNIPLAVNNIHFVTSFREDWRSLAGCYNVAATLYYVVEKDFVLHLAKHITPEMHSQLQSKFPTFGDNLMSLATSHLAYIERNLELGARRGREDDLDRLHPTQCISYKSFIRNNILETFHDPPYCPYSCFVSMHESRTSFVSDREECPLKETSKDIRAAVSYCLRLIAQNNPEEFAKQVQRVFPHWEGKYSGQDFLNLRFNCWDIPAREDVARMLEMLGIGNYVWNFPDLWYYKPLSLYDEDYEGHTSHPPDINFDPLKLGNRFDIRFREKVGFSATATAIRFLGRLTLQQRTQIRRVTLQEDTDSVNVPSLHAQGLVPFFKENTQLQVERRVSVLGCMSGNPSALSNMLSEDVDDDTRQIWAPDFSCAVSYWLLDALDILKSGVPTKSFTLVLEAGQYGGSCTELFQRYVHRYIAKSKAYPACLDKGYFQSFSPEEVHKQSSKFEIDDRFEGAVQHLVNQTSILRCDFDLGTPEDFETLVKETAGLDDDAAYDKWFFEEISGLDDIPKDVYDAMTVPRLEFETWDDYLKANGPSSGSPDKKGT